MEPNESHGLVASQFADLKRQLRSFIAAAAPTDKNLHLAAFKRLSEASLAELTRIAKEGLSKLDEHRDYFLKRDLYADGMFWYELFLTISHGAQSYKGATASPLDPSAVEELVRTLVRVAEYTTKQPGNDIYKRNQEALGDVLLHASDETLIQRARETAASLKNAEVIGFVEETIEKVRALEARRGGPDGNQ